MRPLLLLAVALAACGGERPDPGGGAEAPAPDAAAARPPSDFAAFPAAGVPDYTPMRERGLGVLHLDADLSGRGAAVDTLAARERPDPTAPVLARLMLDSVHVYRYEARAGLLAAPGVLEYGYEDVGFPILDRGTDGWERIYLGTDAAGSVVSGWGRAQPGLAAVTLWEELLPELPVFFVVPADSIRFHAAPDGPEERFELEGDDYILNPLERRGDWLRVRASAPSDYCAALDAPPTRQDTLWIRWRTPAGRPRVWFFTRGC